ncbi:MAG: TlpA disulfide reductase family protein, partial [Sedimenticola sp.]
LLNFWATWCPPCVKEIPSLGRLKRKLSDRAVAVLSVDVGESVERVEAFLKKVPADFPVMLDPEGATVKTWKLRAFPTTFLIDGEGRIRYAYFGGLEWDTPEVVTLIEKILEE